MADRRYGCIIADPPWRYGGSDQFQAGESGRVGAETGDLRRASRYYPTMAKRDICALPVRDFAADDCVLLLWATLPLLPDALDVADAWGFGYKTGMPWIKVEGDPRRNLWGEWEYRPQYGVGFWARACAELVLICTRGNPKPPPAAAASVGIISANFGHSRKPDNLYEYAELFAGPYLELFARRPRAGWDVWGNEVNSTLDLTPLLGG